MTKTVHPVLKKTGAVLLTVLVLVLMAVPAFAVALPDAPTGYVYGRRECAFVLDGKLY